MWRKPKTKEVLFTGTVHLRQAPDMISTFDGEFWVLESSLVHRKTDLIIPLDNVAYLQGKYSFPEITKEQYLREIFKK